MNVESALELIDGGVLYGSANQLQLSIDRNLIGTPGNKLYTYSNAEVMLAGEVVRSATQMDPHSYLDSKISSVIGFSGEWSKHSLSNIMTYCCIDSTPKDIARFGLLFSRKGEWNGTQVLPESWVLQSTTKALSGEYGFLWCRDGNH